MKLLYLGSSILTGFLKASAVLWMSLNTLILLAAEGAHHFLLLSPQHVHIWPDVPSSNALPFLLSKFLFCFVFFLLTDYNSSDLKTACRKHELYVSFQDLGWQVCDVSLWVNQTFCYEMLSKQCHGNSTQLCHYALKCPLCLLTKTSHREGQINIDSCDI